MTAVDFIRETTVFVGKTEQSYGYRLMNGSTNNHYDRRS
jgi:hypothetical protein